MKDYLKKGQLNIKLKERSPRFSLTVLFAGASFAILLAALIIVGAAALILVNTGVISIGEGGLLNVNQLIGLMVLVIIVFGIAFSFIFGRLFMKPINTIINMMNRLARGEYRSRIAFNGALAKNQTVCEMTNSINKMAEELENTEMLRSDFINNFSHEFKTPIVSIAGFAKLLKTDDISPEKRREYLDIIEEESRRLAEMATNVLNLTRVENQTILTDISTFNLSEQIRMCVLILENKWSEKKLDLQLGFDEYFVTGSEELLRQVWLNLLDNAIKFTPFGGTVSVRIGREKDRIIIRVRNTGSTVEEKDRERIFRKFYQCDTSHSTQGNGVGLAVVKRIVDLHSGSVRVDSENDLTEFTVVLPQPKLEK